MNRKADPPITRERLVKALRQEYKASPQGWGSPHQAAVLVPLVLEEGEWHLLFTQRTDFIATHKSQISFPGGHAEPADASPYETALREAFEETGIRKQSVDVIGVLDEFVTFYGVRITPVTGIVEWPQPLLLSADEVSRAFTIPLRWFTNGNNLETRLHSDPEGFEREVLYYRPYGSDIVWGITAQIIQMLVSVIQK